MYDERLIKRFESKFVRGDGCWVWLGWRRKGKWDYGHFAVGRRMQWAHRVAWEIYRGPIPDGLWVLHSCDNPPCVNPAHLFLGTHSDNMRDCASKGRHPTLLKGPEHRKLTNEQILGLRALSRCDYWGKASSIACALGVSRATITNVRHYRSWKSLT